MTSATVPDTRVLIERCLLAVLDRVLFADMIMPPPVETNEREFNAEKEALWPDYQKTL